MFNNPSQKIFFITLQHGHNGVQQGLSFLSLDQNHAPPVLARDGAKACVVRSPDYAAKDRPERAIETDDIQTIYSEMAASVPRLLHPNGEAVALRPRRAGQFAMRDSTSACIIFRQWPTNDRRGNA